MTTDKILDCKLIEDDNINDPFIYINPNALNKMVCKDIIKLFDLDETKGQGMVSGGYRPEIKNALNLDIKLNNPKWTKIYDALIKELHRNIKKYIKQVDIFSGGTYLSDAITFLQCDDPMLQKYIKNEGKYIYHDDFKAEYENYRYRVFTYIFYLNDVFEGGETEFLFGKYKIKPSAGKLILFPASWTYPHCGKMPYSNDKYIITGWLYENEDKRVMNYVNNYKNNKNKNNKNNILK